MNNPITENLPADLPEDWSLDDTLAPEGTYVGLTEQHGYNYLMQAVNAAQRAAKQLGEALAAVDAADVGAYSKEESLTSQTAALYGLDGASMPNDAFSFLGRYTQWRWIRRTYSPTYSNGVVISQPVPSPYDQFTIKYADSISVVDGVTQLDNPRTVTSMLSALGDFDVLRGKYVKSDADGIYFVSGSATFRGIISENNKLYGLAVDGAASLDDMTFGPWEELRANTDDAYPDSGMSGGYEYEAQGMPLEKAAALSPNGGSSGGGSGESWKVGTGLKLSSNVLSVDTANAVTAGDARPVTSGAVKTALDGSKWTAGSGLKLTGSTLAVDTAASVETGGNKPVTAAAVKTALQELTPSSGGFVAPVFVPATIQFTPYVSGTTASPQGSTRLWLLYDGVYFWLPGDATFVFPSAVKLISFTVTISADTGYKWGEPVSSGDVLSVIQTTYQSNYVSNHPNRINVSFPDTSTSRTYTLLSDYPYTDTLTICAGVMGTGKKVDA